MSFGSFNKNKNEMLSDINITPLVDVMLVLLIVFMITMPVLTHSIPIELPKSNIEKQDEPKKIIRVSINLLGTYLDGKLISDDDLSAQFLTYAMEDKNNVVAISSDVSVEYRHVVKVLELAQKAGLTKIGFVTEKQ